MKTSHSIRGQAVILEPVLDEDNVIQSLIDSVTPLILRAHSPTQSAPFLRLQDSLGNDLSTIDSTGAGTGNLMAGAIGGAVTLTPATSARNLITPTADVRPLAVAGFGAGTADLFNAIDVNGITCFKIGASGKPTVAKKDAITASTTDVLDLGHNSTGTPAGGFGSRSLFRLESSTTEDREAADFTIIWATATDATRKARLSFNVWDTAKREAIRCEASGTIPLVSVPEGTISCIGPGGSATSEAFGSGASAGGSDSTAIGNAAAATGTSDVVVGKSAVTVGGGGNNTVVGQNASVSGGTANNVVIGTSAATASSRGVSVGVAASASGGVESIALGYFATTTAPNQLVIGSQPFAGVGHINDGYIGNGVTNAAPTAFKLNSSGGSGTNIAGANLTLAGGKGTGSAKGGDLLFQTAPAGGSGTALNALATIFQMTGDSKIGVFGATAVVKQAGASAADIAAVLDVNARAALTALQAALAAYGWVTSPA